MGTPLNRDHSSLLGKRVFLMAENYDLCSALKRVLEDAGCVLFGCTTDVSCETGNSSSGHIDVALIDLPREKLLHLELARQFITRNIPVVLIAHDLADKLLQQLQSGPPLTKPFTEQELLDRMVEAVHAGDER